MAVRVELLGRFRVLLGDRDLGCPPERRAAELVALLALADGHGLLREQVLDALWPHLDAGAGAANLRKAAHHARQALAHQDAVVLRAGRVALFPDAEVGTDVADFERAALAALRGGDAAACASAAAAYAGELLPGALYAEWTQEARGRLRVRHLDLLRRAGLWERVAAEEPTDEPAHRALMRAALASGNRHAAIRWYGRLRAALGRELGVRPEPETEALYDRCVAGLRPAEPEIVGRQVELAHAQAALRSPGAALAVRGSAGIGKSALCGRVAALARAEGWLVATVAPTTECDPYEPLRALIEQVGAHASLDGLSDVARGVLAGVRSPEQGPAVTRHQVIGAVRKLLDAAGRPVLLVVDDAHLADDATVEALLHLAGPRHRPLLSYRPERARDVLALGVARLARAGTLTAVDLGPLAREDAAALVGDREPAAVAAILDLAGGNPFFVIELAKADGDPAASAWQAVTDRFVDLDAATTAVLRRLAVAGDDLDPSAITAVTALPEDDAFALLDAAIAADVLVVAGAGYRFRHDLVRQALAEQVPPHRRVACHRDAARGLAEAGGPPAAIARHWLAGGRPDEALGWLLDAARRATRLGAFRDALGLLDTLVGHAPEHAAALALRADALEALGDPRAPVAFAAAARAADPESWHEIRAKQALASVRAGDPEAGLRALDGVAPTTVAGKLAHALARGGVAAMGVGDPTSSALANAETRRLAVESGDPSAIVIAAWAEAAAEHARGELPRSLVDRLRETHALPELAITVFDGQLCVTERLLYGGRPYAEVIAFADALLGESERLGAARGRAFATTLRGEALLLSGDLDAATADLTEGARLHRAMAAGIGEAFSLQRLAEVALHRGRTAEADALLDDALAVARETNQGFHLMDRIYGTRIAAAADPAAALAAVEEAEDAVHGAYETCPGCRITLAVPAAIAAAGAGDLDRARAYASAVERLVTLLMRLPGWYAALEEVRAGIAAAEGDHRTAAAHLAAAATGYERAGQPLDARRCAGNVLGTPR